MPLVCGVSFRGAGKVYHFDPGELPVALLDYVIVSTARGDELGQVTEAPHEIDDAEIIGELKRVLRKASASDLERAENYRLKETEVVGVCQEQIGRFGLEMKIISAEYSYDGSRLTFYFTAEERVDFRALVRHLARTFRARIDLRQIGVRDEARLVGGLGPCGRPLCCATWLTQFQPVSIRMAKLQNLPLSPNEISGLCGRLLCCLTYENDYYREVAGRFPRVGRTVDTPYGPAKVIKVSVLRESVTLLLEDGTTVEMTAEQLSGAEPLTPRAERGTSTAFSDASSRPAGQPGSGRSGGRGYSESPRHGQGDARSGGRDQATRQPARGASAQRQPGIAMDGEPSTQQPGLPAQSSQRGRLDVQAKPRPKPESIPEDTAGAVAREDTDHADAHPGRPPRRRAGRRRRGPRRSPTTAIPED